MPAQDCIYLPFQKNMFNALRNCLLPHKTNFLLFFLVNQKRKRSKEVLFLCVSAIPIIQAARLSIYMHNSSLVQNELKTKNRLLRIWVTELCVGDENNLDVGTF